MAEILDDFSSDPFAANWTNELDTAVWDSTDLELDMPNNGPEAQARRSAGGPGSIEHEAQVTCTTASGAGLMGPMVRMGNNGNNDGYAINVIGGNFVFHRFQGGGRLTIDVVACPATIVDGRWYTICYVAEGVNGANVVLKVRIVDHGTSKPSDPGWLDMTTPDASFTDSDAVRLDDDTLHLHCGIGGDDIGGGAAVDTRHDFWKARNITDRSGPVYGAIVINLLN